jgi:nucleoside-diphosphate-sugar epimerase
MSSIRPIGLNSITIDIGSKEGTADRGCWRAVYSSVKLQGNGYLVLRFLAGNLAKLLDEVQPDEIYNLAAILSVVGEAKPLEAWHIGINGLLNVLEVSREYRCAVFTPSSIGAFGASSPLDNTPQDTIQRPQTMYGIQRLPVSC